MIKLQVLTAWELVDGENIVPVELLPGDSAMDVTGQQEITPKPNAVVWEIWNQSNDISSYEAQDFLILWTEDIPDEEPI